MVLLTSWPQPAPEIAALLVPDDASSSLPLGLRLFRTVAPPLSHPRPVHFANGLTLLEVRPVPAEEGRAFLSTWQVSRPLDLPPMPIIANPPPPGVYNGPRLVIFTHLLSAEGDFIVGDDWLWVDPLTLHPGDIFVQLHRLLPPPDAPAAHTFELGLYDPMTGERWPVLNPPEGAADDRVLIGMDSW